MARNPAVPDGYECPYRQACPHLQGMSAEWMWLRHQEDVLARHELRRQIDELVAQSQQQDQRLAQLESQNAALQALHRQQFKRRRKPPASPAGADPAGAEPGKKKKKRGAPKGHPPWTRRPPKHVDRRVEVPAPRQCPHCECDHLLPRPERSEHLQEDIVLCPRTQVTCFDHAQAFCPVCDRLVMQAGEGELIGCYIGPVAKSAAVYLRHAIGMSLRNVKKIMTQMFGLSMVPASVLGFEKAACAKGQSLYEDLHQKIQASAYLHADETSWRMDGQAWWLWYAGHRDLAYYHLDPHRSKEAAQAVIGPGFNGILNTDDYASYNAVPARARQSCLAHPLRLAREALQAIAGLKDATVVEASSQRFLSQAKTFLKEACETGQQLRGAPLPRKEANRLKKYWLGRLTRMCSKKLAWEPAEKLRERLRKQRQHLLTFLHHPAVEPTNNQAEQSLRRSVILRKITFGNRSPEGARRQALLTSLITTAQRQERDPRAALETLWTQPTAVAQAAFYRQKTTVKKRRRKKKNASSPHTGKDPPKTS
jgi:transposase